MQKFERALHVLGYTKGKFCEVFPNHDMSEDLRLFSAHSNESIDLSPRL